MLNPISFIRKNKFKKKLENINQIIISLNQINNSHTNYELYLNIIEKIKKSQNDYLPSFLYFKTNFNMEEFLENISDLDLIKQNDDTLSKLIELLTIQQEFLSLIALAKSKKVEKLFGELESLKEPYEDYDSNDKLIYYNYVENILKDLIKNQEYSFSNVLKLIIPYSSSENKSHLLFHLDYLSKDLKNHRLYSEQKEYFFNKNKNIIRSNFDKTGKKTILLGGKLVGKAIIRLCSESDYKDWNNLFVNKKIWTDNGFDYVPIEPILKASKTKDNQIYRVYCKVIMGITIENLLQDPKYKHLKPHILEKRNKILQILNTDFNFCHTHPHNGNFLIEYDKNQKINPKFSKNSKIYLIDFN
jgi:hypothetical protein